MVRVCTINDIERKLEYALKKYIQSNWMDLSMPKEEQEI